MEAVNLNDHTFSDKTNWQMLNAAVFLAFHLLSQIAREICLEDTLGKMDSNTIFILEDFQPF